jgi:hypothetical protein
VAVVTEQLPITVKIELCRVGDPLATQLRVLGAGTNGRDKILTVKDADSAKIRAIKRLLSESERHGLEVIYGPQTDEYMVISVKPWTGHFRHIAYGVQVRRGGRLYNYQTMRAYQADKPMHERDTFENFLIRRGLKA